MLYQKLNYNAVNEQLPRSSDSSHATLTAQNIPPNAILSFPENIQENDEASCSISVRKLSIANKVEKIRRNETMQDIPSGKCSTGLYSMSVLICCMKCGGRVKKCLLCKEIIPKKSLFVYSF